MHLVRHIRKALLVLLACLIGICPQAKAKPDNPFWVTWEETFRNQKVANITFLDTRTGWVVGDGGTILATRNGGTSWEAQHSGTDKDLSRAFADAQTRLGGGRWWDDATCPAQFLMSPSVDVSTAAAPTTSGGDSLNA
jgi:hypothetical protein